MCCVRLGGFGMFCLLFFCLQSLVFLSVCLVFLSGFWVFFAVVWCYFPCFSWDQHLLTPSSSMHDMFCGKRERFNEETTHGA